MFKDSPKQAGSELYSSTKRKVSEREQWETPCSREWRLPSADLAYFLVRFTAQIWDAVNRLMSLMLLHMSINFTVRGDLVNSKCEHEAPGLRIKGMGTQVVFSSVLKVRGKGLRSREEEWADQQLAAQFVVIAKILFL